MQLIMAESIVAMDAILEMLEPRLPHDAYQRLDDPISLQELRSAAKKLVYGQSPRLDDHAIELYVKLLPIIDMELHSMVLDSIHT